VATTHDSAVARRLSLVWGVTALVVAESPDLEHAFAEIARALETAGLGRPGDRFAVVAGVTQGVSGATDLVKVHEIP
jgi:pyruvate kinase